MRQVNNQLRGLLKNPNRPQNEHKNRVVFDETRNQFFEADYIILVREECHEAYDSHACSCEEHELIRLCCEEDCQHNYLFNSGSVPPTQSFYPTSVRLLDETTLSPPDDYKDNEAHFNLTVEPLQQNHGKELPLIESLEFFQDKTLLKGTTHQGGFDKSTHIGENSIVLNENPNIYESVKTICAECAECNQCKKELAQDENQREVNTLQNTLLIGALSQQNHSNQRARKKEIVAGEERPAVIKSLRIRPSVELTAENFNELHAAERNSSKNEESSQIASNADSVKVDLCASFNQSEDVVHISSPKYSSGILKNGKFKRIESQEKNNSQSATDFEDKSKLNKRSVHFIKDNGEITTKRNTNKEIENADLKSEDSNINDLIPIKRHSTLFNNALRPNSAVRQLFPHNSVVAPILTTETLRAFDESKKSTLSNHFSDQKESDLVHQTTDHGHMRRSLVNRKNITKTSTSLEERIKQLTCNIEESLETSSNKDSFSKGSAESDEKSAHFFRSTKDTEFSEDNCERENSFLQTSPSFNNVSPIHLNSSRTIDPQRNSNAQKLEDDLKLTSQEYHPTALDIGLGSELNAPITLNSPQEAKRQFLSSLVPLTACVAAKKNDSTSFYSLAAPSNQAMFKNSGNPQKILFNVDGTRKITPDVLAGTPGQEHREYTKEIVNITSDDEEQSDYGFSRRPSVRGIKQQLASPNEISSELQDRLSMSEPNKCSELKSQCGSNNNFRRQSNLLNNARLPFSSSPLHAHCAKINVCNSNPIQQSKFTMQTSMISQQQTEQHTWTFYSETPIDTNMSSAGGRLPGSAFFGESPIHLESDPSMSYISPFSGEKLSSMNEFNPYTDGSYGVVKKPESPPPLKNYHQTMVFIPFTTQACPQHIQNIAEDKIPHIHQQNWIQYHQICKGNISNSDKPSMGGNQLRRHSTSETQIVQLETKIFVP